MAWMNQEKKAVIAAKLKEVVPPSWKYSLGVRNKSTIVFTVRSAPVDLVGEWLGIANRVREHRGMELLERGGSVSINDYYVADQFDESLGVMVAIHEALDTDNHDRSDSQTDYFDVGHYIDMNIGAWDKPFIFTGQPCEGETA